MTNHYQKKLKSTFFEVFTTSEIFALIFIFDQIISFLFNESMSSQKLFTSSFISFSTLSITLFVSIKFILFILFATFFATSKKQIFWAKVISKLISSKLSRLFRFVSKIAIIFASISSTRFYIIMNDLFVIFNKKSKLLNLSHRQKSLFFSYYWQLNITSLSSYILNNINKNNLWITQKVKLIEQTNVKIKCSKYSNHWAYWAH